MDDDKMDTDDLDGMDADDSDEMDDEDEPGADTDGDEPQYVVIGKNARADEIESLFSLSVEIAHVATLGELSWGGGPVVAICCVGARRLRGDEVHGGLFGVRDQFDTREIEETYARLAQFALDYPKLSFCLVVAGPVPVGFTSRLIETNVKLKNLRVCVLAGKPSGVLTVGLKGRWLDGGPWAMRDFLDLVKSICGDDNVDECSLERAEFLASAVPVCLHAMESLLRVLSQFSQVSGMEEEVLGDMDVERLAEALEDNARESGQAWSPYPEGEYEIVKYLVEDGLGRSFPLVDAIPGSDLAFVDFEIDGLLSVASLGVVLPRRLVVVSSPSGDGAAWGALVRRVEARGVGTSGVVSMCLNGDLDWASLCLDPQSPVLVVLESGERIGDPSAQVLKGLPANSAFVDYLSRRAYSLGEDGQLVVREF